MRAATPQETYDHTIGAGALTWSWWHGVKVTGADADGNVTPDWSAVIRSEDGNGDVHPVTISHAVIMRAARGLITDETPKVSSATLRACIALVADADEADFDADTADQLLQIIALGEVVFG